MRNPYFQLWYLNFHNLTYSNLRLEMHSRFSQALQPLKLLGNFLFSKLDLIKKCAYATTLFGTFETTDV